MLGPFQVGAKMVNGVRIERDREKERQREKEDPETNARRKERMIGKRDLSFYSSSFHRNPRNPKPVSNGPAFQETSSRTTCTFFIEIDDIRSAPHDFLRWMYELLFPLPLSLSLSLFLQCWETKNHYSQPQSGFMISYSILIGSSIVPIFVVLRDRFFVYTKYLEHQQFYEKWSAQINLIISLDF